MNDSSDKTFLEWLEGSWEGTCRTWFEPGKLADESLVKAVFEVMWGCPIVRHSYEGSIQGKPRMGQEWISRNAVTEEYQIAWADSFHMNYAIMMSHGPATESGFEVFGRYDVEQGVPAWGWKTRYQKTGEDELTMIAYNVSPESVESKALETIYKRS